MIRACVSLCTSICIIADRERDEFYWGGGGISIIIIIGNKNDFVCIKRHCVCTHEKYNACGAVEDVQNV